MPKDLHGQYQTWTRADTRALSLAGVDVNQFKTVKQGIAEYINYLKVHRYY